MTAQAKPTKTVTCQWNSTACVADTTAGSNPQNSQNPPTSSDAAELQKQIVDLQKKNMTLEAQVANTGQVPAKSCSDLNKDTCTRSCQYKSNKCETRKATGKCAGKDGASNAASCEKETGCAYHQVTQRCYNVTAGQYCRMKNSQEWAAACTARGGVLATCTAQVGGKNVCKHIPKSDGTCTLNYGCNGMSPISGNLGRDGCDTPRLAQFGTNAAGTTAGNSRSICAYATGKAFGNLGIDAAAAAALILTGGSCVAVANDPCTEVWNMDKTLNGGAAGACTGIVAQKGLPGSLTQAPDHAVFGNTAVHTVNGVAGTFCKYTAPTPPDDADRCETDLTSDVDACSTLDAATCGSTDVCELVTGPAPVELKTP